MANQNFAAARKFFEIALQINPNYAFILSNYAHLLNLDGEYLEAKRNILRAIEQMELPLFHMNLGAILSNLDDHEGAINSYKRALFLSKPEDAKTKAIIEHNYAMSLFALNRYKEGWPFYESRYLASDKVGAFTERFKDYKKLMSLDDIEGKHIYIYNEQGIGDLIMLARYVPVLQDLGAKVTLEVQSEIAILMEPFADAVQARTKTWRNVPDGVDYVASINCLPKFWPDDFTPPPLDFKTAWKLDNKVEKDSIGVCWCGSTEHVNDNKRSVTVEMFKPFAKKKKLYNLSKTESPSWVTTSPLHDYLDTIKLINKMECVVTVDTSIVHLAASMGKPTYLLVPRPRDWRWLCYPATKIRWYGDHLKLCGQKDPGDWTKPFEMALKLVNGKE